MDYQPLPILSNQFPEAAKLLIDSAIHSIDVIVFDWRFYVNDPGHPVSQFNQTFASAVRRGVKVRALVQSDISVQKLKELGIDARKLNSKKILHTKMLLVDNDRIIIGSHNYTQRAFLSNHEASIFVHLGTKENAFVEYFNNLFGL